MRSITPSCGSEGNAYLDDTQSDAGEYLNCEEIDSLLPQRMHSLILTSRVGSRLHGVHPSALAISDMNPTNESFIRTAKLVFGMTAMLE